MECGPEKLAPGVSPSTIRNELILICTLDYVHVVQWTGVIQPLWGPNRLK